MSDNTEAEEMTMQTSLSQSHVDVDRNNNMDDRDDGDNDVAPPASYNCKDLLQSTDTILEEQPSSSTPSTAANIDCAADNVEGVDEGNDGLKTSTTDATTTEVEQDDDNEENDAVEEIVNDDPDVLPPTQDIEKGTYPTIIPSVDDDNDGVQQGDSAIMRQALGVSGVDTVGSDSAPSTQPGAVWMFPRESSPGEGDVIDAAVSDPLPICKYIVLYLCFNWSELMFEIKLSSSFQPSMCN